MRTAVALSMLVGLVQLAQANWFKEFDSSDTECKSTPFKKHTESEIDNDGCIAVDEGTVSIISHSNYWTDIGYLYGYNTSDCSSATIGKLPTSDSTCWSIDDFNGEGWGQTVKGIMLDVVE